MSDSPPSAPGAKASVNDAEYEWLYGAHADETTSTATNGVEPGTPDGEDSAGPDPDVDPTATEDLEKEATVNSPTEAPQTPAPTSASDPEGEAAAPAVEEPSTVSSSNAAASTAPRPPIAAVIVARTLMTRLKVPALLALAFAAWMALGSPIPGSSPDADPEAGTARNAMADPVMAQALNDQKAAETYLAKHGNLNGFTLRGKGVRFAAAGSTFLASRLVDGICYAYAWEGAGQNKPVQDATGAACTDEQITQAQIVLDDQSVALAEAADNQATAAFTAASATASQFAINNWVGGAPSLTGLGDNIGSGVRVVENTGTWLIAQYGEGTSCRQATIAADAAVGEITPCP